MTVINQPSWKHLLDEFLRISRLLDSETRPWLSSAMYCELVWIWALLKALHFNDPSVFPVPIKLLRSQHEILSSRIYVQCGPNCLPEFHQRDFDGGCSNYLGSWRLRFMRPSQDFDCSPSQVETGTALECHHSIQTDWHQHDQAGQAWQRLLLAIRKLLPHKANAYLCKAIDKYFNLVIMKQWTDCC